MKPLFGGLTKGPTGVFKSVLDTARTDGKRRDEIYVDVVERLSATFNAAGNLVSSQIDGSIQVCVVSVGGLSVLQTQLVASLRCGAACAHISWNVPEHYRHSWRC
jgi:hypothetical protein